MSVFIASAYEIGVCDDKNCRCVHFAMLNGAGARRASAAINIEQVPALIKQIQDAAYSVAVTKDRT